MFDDYVEAYEGLPSQIPWNHNLELQFVWDQPKIAGINQIHVPWESKQDCQKKINKTVDVGLSNKKVRSICCIR